MHPQKEGEGHLEERCVVSGSARGDLNGKLWNLASYCYTFVVITSLWVNQKKQSVLMLSHTNQMQCFIDKLKLPFWLLSAQGRHSGVIRMRI